MITTDDVKEFKKAIEDERFFDSHEILDKIWFKNRFNNTKEIQLLKGFINACVSFELHKRGRIKASKKVWKTYLKYRQLLFKTGSQKVKLYYDIFLEIEKTKKGLS